MNSFPSLGAWLTHLESAHPVGIDMGLERISKVRDALNLSFDCPIFTVGGTNGKGSTCAILESILLQAGYLVGCHMSPHLLTFNERARINGRDATDDELLPHFEAVERARAGLAKSVSLTYFEFTTLAIMRLFASRRLDAVILEVGMGGRLDAVNILDADCAIVTSIDIDHAEYLGDTRDKIGFEKAGIFRPGRPAICADVMPPQSLVQHAEKINANLWLFGRDFRHDVQPGSGREHWNYVGPTTHIPALPRPNLKGVNQLFNASAALAGLEALSARLPVTELDVSRGLARVTLPGRFQVVAGPPTVVLDVGHNPHASANLARNLNNMGSVGSTYAVFGAMRDKDISGVLTNLKNEIDHWHLTELSTPRSASIAQLSESLRAAEIIETNANKIRGFMSPAAAFEDALRRAGLEDRIVVFGSFYTVAGVIEYRTATDELACSDATGRKNNFCNERRVVAMAEAEYKEGSTDSQREAEGQFGRAYASKEGALRKGRAERNVGNWAWMEAGHHYDWMDQHAPFENL